MQIRSIFWRVLLLAFFILAIFTTFTIAFFKSPRFTHITLAEWVQSDLFTPVILQPEPDGTKLRLGPLHGADRVELHYTEEFEFGVLPIVYELYESGNPLPIGKKERSGILPDYGATNQDVEIAQTTLTLIDMAHPVELRQNKNRVAAGIAIFEIDGTYVVYHWQNVDQVDALQTLVDSIALVGPDDVELVSTFDQRLASRGQSR